MSMTNEEIKAARSEIRRHLIAFKEMFIFPADIDNFTLPMLDALCAEVEALKAVIEQIKRFDGYIVDDAYRAMKGEKDAVSPERLQPKVKLDPDYAKRLNDAD